MAWCLVEAWECHHNRHTVRSSTLDHAEPINCRTGDPWPLRSQNPFTSLEVFFVFGSPNEILEADIGMEMRRSIAHAAQIQLVPVWADQERGLAIAGGGFESEQFLIEGYRPIELGYEHSADANVKRGRRAPPSAVLSAFMPEPPREVSVCGETACVVSIPQRTPAKEFRYSADPRAGAGCSLDVLLG